MQLIQKLSSVISEYDLLKHDFYQAWSKGELNIEILQRYAAQYYYQVDSFPRFISRVHTRCPEISARKLLLENLNDEEQGTDHPTLWMHFAEGLGLTRQAVLNDMPLPETEHMVDKFYELADRDWRQGLCALFAYEHQVPAVSASKIEGLKKFYGITDEKTLKFFTEHQIYDVKHSEQVAALIEEYVDPEVALTATREAAQVLWGFLDGMCRTCHVACAAAA